MQIDDAQAADGSSTLERPAAPLNLWERFEDHVLLNIGTVLLVAALLTMLFEALSRFLVSESYDWAQELVRYAVAWSFFLCPAVSARHGFHIRAEMLLDRFSPRMRHGCDVVSAICGVLFSAFLLIAGVLQVRQLMRNGMLTESTLDWPLWTVQIILPTGAALLLVFYIAALWRGLTGRPVFAKTIEIE